MEEAMLDQQVLLMNWEQAQQDFASRISFETRLKAMERDDPIKAKQYMEAHIDAIHILLGTLDQYEKHLMGGYAEYPFAYGAMIQVIGNTTRQFQRLMRILGPMDDETIQKCLNTIATDRPQELVNGIDHFDDVFLGSLFAERNARAAQQAVEDWDAGITASEEE